MRWMAFVLGDIEGLADAGEVLRKGRGGQGPKILRLVVGNPLIMKEMAKTGPDAAAYAPTTILIDERLHAIAIGAKFRTAGVDMRVKTFHHHPQQSVLNRQEGQRQTACMRYMSAPQRSHFI